MVETFEDELEYPKILYLWPSHQKHGQSAIRPQTAELGWWLSFSPVSCGQSELWLALELCRRKLGRGRVRVVANETLMETARASA